MAKRKSISKDGDSDTEVGASSSSARSSQDSTADGIKQDSDKLIKYLNALPTCQFRDEYIPTDRLAYALGPKPEEPPRRKQTVSIDFKAALDLSKEELDSCFSLIERTSREDYEPSSFGWHPKRKRREMQEREMRYLLVREPVTTTVGEDETTTDLQGAETVAGFVSFMLTHDSVPAVPVLYLYELHLEAALRGTGLGSHLMALVETIARGTGMEKVMLTCFVSNEKARKFYETRGFGRDVSSPEERRTRRKVLKVDYVIMSKEMDAGGEGTANEEGKAGKGLLDAVRDWTAKLAGQQVRSGNDVAQMRGWV